MHLKKTFYILSVFFCAAIFSYARFVEPQLLNIKTVEFAGLAITKNCTLAFISDLHELLLPAMDRKLLNALERARPDFILIGGDFSAYRTPAAYSIEKIKLLSKFAKVIMVMGNTDQCGSRQCIYCSLKYPVDRLESLPARILRNEIEELPEFGISVCGLDDPVTDQDDMLIFKSLKKTQYNILLVHSIYKVPDERKKLFDLICAGHTHGGQIFFLKPFLHAFDPAIDPKYTGGLYTFGKTGIIVSNGIGQSFLPFRFGVLPEITFVNLRKQG